MTRSACLARSHSRRAPAVSATVTAASTATTSGQRESAAFPAGSFDGMLWLWTIVRRRLLSTLVLLSVQGAWSEVHREEPDERVVTCGAPGDRLC